MISVVKVLMAEGVTHYAGGYYQVAMPANCSAGL